MIGFCGALDFERNAVSFSKLKKICGLHGAGCAFIKDEFGIICDCDGSFDEHRLQPVTLSYNGSLYTAAIVAHEVMATDERSTAQGILEGYFELGEEFIQRLCFSYALVLYDSRCGELLLSKGEKGDKALFYTVRDGTLYFASSVRPLIRLYGGCVRISKNALYSHINGGIQTLPSELFCDIKSIKRGQSLFCSRLGRNIIPTPCGIYSFEQTEKALGYTPELSRKTDMRRVLTDALFAFEYPQFDCFMPSLLPYVADAKRNGFSEICIADAFKNTNGDYSAERAERLGSLWNVHIKTVSAERELPSGRDLKFIEKSLDRILDGYMEKPYGAFSALLATGILSEIDGEKQLSLRIRKKGMLIQCAMWFDTYNLVLV